MTNFANVMSSGLYYKPMMIINDNSRVITKFETSLTDDARVVIYDHHMFIVQVSISPTFYKQLFHTKVLCVLCAYNLGLYFFGKRILALKLLIKCW